MGDLCRLTSHPRSACGAPPQGGAASGPAKPVPRRPLEDRPPWARRFQRLLTYEQSDFGERGGFGQALWRCHGL
ncbi:hypothetical protein EXH46_09785 [Pelomonas puraquae]|nr:hypothetical protein [Roseateles puraquae]